MERDSPTHCALMSPEILEIIFLDVFQGLLCDYTRYALVCKLWSSVATDLIWRTCQDPAAFFSKLAPMVQVVDETFGGCYVFTRPIEDDDWERFKPYASRVRRFHTIQTRIHPKAYEEIARTRPGGGPVFPNLRRLIWDEDISLSLMFMHDMLRGIYVTLTRSDRIKISSEPLVTTFTKMGQMAPNLTGISIEEYGYVPDASNALRSFFPNLAKLQTVILGPTLLTNDVIEVLASLEHLSSLNCDEGTDVERNDEGLQVVRLPPLDFTLQPSSFLSLREFDVFQPLRTVIPFIGQRFFPDSLRSILVETPVPESAARIHRFFSLLARRFSALQDVFLLLSPTPHILQPDPEHVIDREQVITFDTLKPVLKLSNLKILSIDHATSLDVSAADFESLISHLPLLEILSLAPAPVYAYNPVFNLEILIVVARHCRHLDHLSLFLDATAPCPLLDPNHPSFDPSILFPFTSLTRFAGGLSPITKDVVNQVALYLAQLLPDACIIDSNLNGRVDWDMMQDQAAQDVTAAVENMEKIWRSVSSTFKQLKRKARGRGGG